MKQLRSALLALVVGTMSIGCAASSAPVMAAAPTVRAGSLARFIVRDEILYALNGQQLIVYDVSQGGHPKQLRSVATRGDAETLFPYGHLLFVGTRQGMLVYELAHDPTAPVLIGEAQHVVSCDPVVVEKDIAYVTLRSGSTCRQGLNALLVFDVQDPSRPTELRQHPLPSPRGVGVDGSTLFVADEKMGLLIFDVRNPREPQLIGDPVPIAGYDLVANAGTLFVSAEDGLYQYHYGPRALDPKPISRIPIGAPKLEVARDSK